MESEDELRRKALSHQNQKDTIKKASFRKIINNYQMSFNIQPMFIFPNLFTNIKKKKKKEKTLIGDLRIALWMKALCNQV